MCKLRLSVAKIMYILLLLGLLNYDCYGGLDQSHDICKWNFGEGVQDFLANECEGMHCGSVNWVELVQNCV